VIHLCGGPLLVLFLQFGFPSERIYFVRFCGDYYLFLLFIEQQMKNYEEINGETTFFHQPGKLVHHKESIVTAT
jgi:hypothetical protein